MDIEIMKEHIIRILEQPLGAALSDNMQLLSNISTGDVRQVGSSIFDIAVDGMTTGMLSTTVEYAYLITSGLLVLAETMLATFLLSAVVSWGLTKLVRGLANLVIFTTKKSA